MTSIRRLIGVVMTVALIVLGLPAHAASGNNKIFTLNMAPASLPVGSSAMTATFNNISPDGNSTFKSLKFYPPTGIKVTAAAVQAGSTYTANVVVGPNGASVTVDSINLPVKPFGPTLVIALTVSNTSASCSAVNGSWTTKTPGGPNNQPDQVWTGAGWTGQNFLFQSQSSNVVTNIAATPCSMTMTGPTSAAVGVPFSVTVNLIGGSGSASVGLTGDATTCGTFGSSSPYSVTGGTGTLSGVTVSKAGSICTLTADATAAGYGTAQVSFPIFKGVLDCGGYDSSNGNQDFGLDPDADQAFVIPNGSGWGLRRGPNRDGSTPCVKVNYSCDLSGSNIATCTWDKSTPNAAGTGTEQATFKYVFVWNAVPADTNGWPVNLHPWVSWKPNPSATPSWPDWMVGLACVNDMFPALPILPTALLPTIPSVSPYTDAANTYGPYQPTGMAMACIAQQGWTSVGTADGTNRAISVQWWTKVIDEADLRVSGP